MKSNQAEGSKLVSGPVRARDVEPEEVSWLWPIGAEEGDGVGRIPRGTLTFVAGRPDRGKGLFVTKVGTDVSRAGGNVLHSAIEDNSGLIPDRGTRRREPISIAFTCGDS